MASGFVLTIDGCPYAFATAGVSSVTSSDENWSSAWTVVAGVLVREDWQWSERTKPLDGDLDVDQLTFSLRDPMMTSGVAAGFHLVTWLTTRRPSRITQSPLAETIAASGSADFDLASGSGFGTSTFVVYVDQEAILCDSRSGVTLTPNASGRGYYGSRSVEHAIDAANAYAPVVYKDFPGFHRRRACFWRVLDGVATLLWIGVCGRSPALDSGGTRYKLQVNHVWMHERERPLAVPSVRTRTTGFDRRAIKLEMSNPDTSSGFHINYIGSGPTYVATNEGYYATLHEAMQACAAALYADATAGGDEYNITGDATSTTAGVHVDSYDVDSFQVWLRIGNGHEVTGHTRPYTGTVLIASMDLRYTPAPRVLTYARSSAAFSVTQVESTQGMPASWADDPTTDSLNLTTTVRPLIRGAYSADYWFTIEPTAAADGVIVGRVSLVPRTDDVEAPAGGDIITDRPLTLSVVARVDAPHWLSALRYGVVNETTSVRSGSDPRNWTFDTYERVLSATGHDGIHRRTWHLGGETTLWDQLSNSVRLDGCGIGVRAGRLCALPFAVPSATDTMAATFSAPDLAEKPQWQDMPDGIANVVSIDSDAGKIIVRDQLSIGRFGQAREIEIDARVLSEGNEAAAEAQRDPFAFAQSVLHRVLGLWANPVAMGRLRVSLDYATALYLGDFVEVTDWLIPDGNGSRGMADARGLIIGRSVSLSESSPGVTLEVVFFDVQARGYAPCVRIESIVDDTLTVSADYLTEATTLCNYTDNDAGGDGGASRFTGATVRLIRRDHDTLVTEPIGEVVSVAGTTIVVDAPVPTIPTDWAALIAGGAWVDLIFDLYDAAGIDDEADYAYVGDYTTGEIGATSDDAHEWAP